MKKRPLRGMASKAFALEKEMRGEVLDETN